MQAPVLDTSSPNNNESPDSPSKSDGNLVEVITCAICMNDAKYPVILSKCKHVFCYMCIKAVNMSNPTNTKCPLCRDEFDEQDLKKVKVADKHKAVQPLIGQDVWVYQSNDRKGYWLFDIDINSQLNDFYTSYMQKQLTTTNITTSDSDDSADEPDEEPRPIIRIGTVRYVIDFESMTQTDYQARKSRNILRIAKFDEQCIRQHHIRGLAGIYFD